MHYVKTCIRTSYSSSSTPHSQDVPFRTPPHPKNLHPHLLVILKTQKNLHPHIRKIHKIFHPHLLLVLKTQKNLHPQIRKRHQILHPHHHTHLLLLLLLMKQQNLHPQTEVLKTIMPKQVLLGLIPL
jgi:hypothetical protein